jgi:acetylornithine deacetylase
MDTEITDLITSLVAIDSTNPSLVPGGAGEGAIAAFIAGWALDQGLRAEVHEATPGRPSVIVRGGQAAGGRTLLLCGHLDTVGTDGMHEPHRARLDGDRLLGRGTYDMKAGVAAALLACRDAARADITGEVVVACVADEEHSSLGIQECLATIRADAAVVTEPTELAVIIAHKGFAWLEVTVEGVAAHGSRWHLGVDAILKTAPILAALSTLDASFAAHPHPVLGRASLHASLIAGGRELSTYPDRCVLSIERRTLPGETAAHIEAELAALLDRCRADDPDLVATGRVTLVRGPSAIEPTHPFVGAIEEAAAAVLGASPSIEGAGYWADSAFITAAGIPTVLFGPVGGGAHANEEHVDLPSVAACRTTLADLARAFCTG